MLRNFANRSGLATAGALGIGCILAAGGLGALALIGEDRPGPLAAGGSPVAEMAASTAASPVDFHELARRCVESFSKDLCEGRLEPGEMVSGGCEETGCKTVYMHGAGWKFILRHNEQLCSAFDPTIGRCDEAFGKDGTIEARVNYTMRYHAPCRFRAGFEGKWTLFAVDGTLYTGTVTGTMGVGSHRQSVCEFGARNCERCLDVTFDPNNGVWRIAVEAAFRGDMQTALPVEPPNQLFFTLSGDFLAPGDANGPFDNAEWKFAGTADGVHLERCP